MHHPNARMPGQHLQAHISHEQVQWTDATTVALPPCPDCGSQMFLNVAFAEQDLMPPVISRDASGKIIDVRHIGATNLTKIWEHIEKRMIVDEERRAVLKQHGFPDALIEALLPPMVVYERVIDRVEPHPAIARHQELVRQLQGIGKGPPGQ